MQFTRLSRLLSFGGLTSLSHMNPGNVSESLLPHLSLGGVRHKRGKINVKAAGQWPGGKKYPGFWYYPRHPDEKDPPYEPSQLFMVKNVKSIRGQPKWEKYIIERHLRIPKVGDVAIVKNTPTVNAMLYKVKHLIEMQPITFPHGKPQDVNNGYLDDYGRFISYNLLPTDLDKAQADVKQLMEKAVDGETLKYRLRYRWLQRWE